MRIIRSITAAVAIALIGALSSGTTGAEEAAPKPQAYKPVAIEPPQPVKDPSFVAFRQQLAEIAKRKDHAAFAKHVAANFFWVTEDGKNAAPRGRSGGDNFVRAFGLDDPDSEGWDILTALVADATADPSPQRKGTICAPGEPKHDPAAAMALGKATGTGSSSWYYPTRDGVEVRSGLSADSKVIGKLGLHLVWVYPDDSPLAAVHAETARIVLPSGQFGFVAADALAPLPGDLLCYVKEGDTWRIAGVLGGSTQGR